MPGVSSPHASSSCADGLGELQLPPSTPSANTTFSLIAPGPPHPSPPSDTPRSACQRHVPSFTAPSCSPAAIRRHPDSLGGVVIALGSTPTGTRQGPRRRGIAWNQLADLSAATAKFQPSDGRRLLRGGACEDFMSRDLRESELGILVGEENVVVMAIEMVYLGVGVCKRLLGFQPLNQLEPGCLEL